MDTAALMVSRMVGLLIRVEEAGATGTTEDELWQTISQDSEEQNASRAELHDTWYRLLAGNALVQVPGERRWTAKPGIVDHFDAVDAVLTAPYLSQYLWENADRPEGDDAGPDEPGRDRPIG